MINVACCDVWVLQAGLLGGDGEDAWDPEKAQGSARAALERLVGKTAAGQRVRRSRKRDRGAMSSGSGAAVAEKKEKEEEEEEGEGEESGSEVEEENEGELKFIDGEEEEEDSEAEDEDEEEEKEDEEEKGEDENEEESKDTKSDDFLLLDVEEEERQRTNDSGSAKRRRVTPEVARAAAAAKSQEKKEAAKAEEEEEDTSVPLLARRVLTQKDFALLDAIGRRMAEGDAARNNKRTKGETMEALAAAAEAALAADSDDEDDMEGVSSFPYGFLYICVLRFSRLTARGRCTLQPGGSGEFEDSQAAAKEAEGGRASSCEDRGTRGCRSSRTNERGQGEKEELCDGEAQFGCKTEAEGQFEAATGKRERRGLSCSIVFCITPCVTAVTSHETRTSGD